jgi:multisubunit Na+/H+ antiporter MnhC subunit
MDILILSALGVIMFALVICLIILAVKFYKNKKNLEINQYDERQRSEINVSYKYSLFTLIFYCAVCAILDISEIKWAELSVLMGYGIMLCAVVFVGVSMFKDAYFTNESKLIRALLWLLLAVAQFTILYADLTEGKSIFKNGLLSMRSLYLGFTVFWTILSILAFVKIIVDKVKVEEE